MSKHSIDLFLDACGSTGQLQVSLECDGKEGAVEKKLFLPCLLAGRDPNTDLPLEDAQVSQRHAFFQILDGRLFCVDLRSRTGTHWGTGPKGSGWVDPGETLRIGPHRLHFSGEGLLGGTAALADLNPLTSPSPELDGLPDVNLEFVKGPTRPMTWRINRALTLVGRSNDCGVALRDGSISYFHAVLLRTLKGTWVMDLLGRGGILLNGRRVRWGRLDAGDQLQVGAYVLRHRSETAFDGAPFPDERVHQAEGANVPEPGGNGDYAGAKNGWEGPGSNGSGQEAAAAPRTALPALRGLDKAGIQEMILAPLVNQFAALQSQMFSQFQQSLLMMVDRFREMHQEQFGLIREEVDRLHRLTAELQTLQTELKKPRPAVVVPAAPPVAKPVATAPVAAPRERVAVPPSPSARPEPPPVRNVTPVDEPLRSAKPEPLNLPAAGSEPDDGAVHLWLHQRITEIHRERESTMKKILNFLVGK